MTNARVSGGGSIRRLWRLLLPPTLLCAVLVFSIFLSQRAAGYALAGITTAVLCVLPTTLPSMLICDLYRAYGAPERMRVLARIFSFVYGVSPAGLRAVLLGNLCGFPMGAREVVECHAAGGITKREAERLLPLTMNPSPPFIVGAVGAAMLGDIREGVLLLSAVAMSSLVVGVIFRKRRANNEIGVYITEQKYSFVGSVKSAAEASVTLIAFIGAFSVLLGFVSELVQPAPLRSVAFALFEVTGGVEYFSELGGISPLLRGALVAFTLGFGGLSVMLQGAAFIGGRLSMRRYIPVKLCQAVICAAIYALLRPVVIT